jgi:hypothetical protein
MMVFPMKRISVSRLDNVAFHPSEMEEAASSSHLF